MSTINWIIVLCVLSSIFSWYLEPAQYDISLSYFAYSGENLFKLRIWTLITALFFHANLLHLGGNMLFLFVFGNTLEKELKAKKTLIAFFIGGILSFLLSTFFYEPKILMIGASAAIFTLTSIVMFIKPLKFSFLFLMPQGLVAILYFIFNITAVYFEVQGNVAFISHISGFVIGVPFGIDWSRDWKRNFLKTIILLIIYYVLQTFLFWTIGYSYYVT